MATLQAQGLAWPRPWHHCTHMHAR